MAFLIFNKAHDCRRFCIGPGLSGQTHGRMLILIYATGQNGPGFSKGAYLS